VHGVLSALVLYLGLPPVSISVAGFFWLIPWLLTARFGPFSSSLNGTVLGASGAGYALYGSLDKYPLLFAAAVVGTATVFGVAGAVIGWRGLSRPAVQGVIWAAVLCGGLMLLRYVGFAASLALPLSAASWAILPVRYLGVVGLDMVVALGQLAIAAVLMRLVDRRDLDLLTSLRSSVVIAAGILVFVMPSLAPPKVTKGNALTVGVAQTAIPAWRNDFRSADGVLEGVLAQKERLLTQAASHDLDLLLWPESSQPGFIRREALPNSTYPRETSDAVTVATHAYLMREPGTVQSVVVSGSSASPDDVVVAGKRRPLPLAERGVTPHKASGQLHQAAGLPFGSLICSASTFPGAAYRLADQGARFTVTLTNDAFLGPSAVTLMHRGAAAIEAVRSGVPMLQVGNGGTSEMVLPSGVRQRVERLYTSGFHVVDLPVGFEDTGASRETMTYLLHALLLLTITGTALPLRASAMMVSNNTSKATQFFLAAAATATVIPWVIGEQGKTFQRMDNHGARIAGAPPRRGLSYDAVTDSQSPRKGGLAMLARELGIPVTAEEMPTEGEATRRWLVDNGIGLVSELASNDERPHPGPGVSYGMVDLGQGPAVIKLMPNGTATVFDPAMGEFKTLQQSLDKWLGLHQVRWAAGQAGNGK